MYSKLYCPFCKSGQTTNLKLKNLGVVEAINELMEYISDENDEKFDGRIDSVSISSFICNSCHHKFWVDKRDIS